MKIEVNGITLNYKMGGKGNPLILLHGNGEDLSIFDALSKKLQKHFITYAIDSRNHGGSSKTGDFGYETMAQDILLFIEKLDLQKVSILGFSDGAIIAVMMDLAKPNSFVKSVLLGINLKPTDFKKDTYEYLVNEFEKTNDPLYKMMLQQPNIELESLKTIATPTLVVRAEDELFNHSLYDDIVQTMPNAKLLVMKGHDHANYIVNNDVLYEDLNNFL